MIWEKERLSKWERDLAKQFREMTDELLKTFRRELALTRAEEESPPPHPQTLSEAVKALWDGVHRTDKIATHNPKLWTDLSAAMVVDEERRDRLEELVSAVRKEAGIYGLLPGTRFSKAIKALVEEAERHE